MWDLDLDVRPRHAAKVAELSLESSLVRRELGLLFRQTHLGDHQVILLGVGRVRAQHQAVQVVVRA